MLLNVPNVLGKAQEALLGDIVVLRLGVTDVTGRPDYMRCCVFSRDAQHADEQRGGHEKPHVGPRARALRHKENCCCDKTRDFTNPGVQPSMSILKIFRNLVSLVLVLFRPCLGAPKGSFE